MVAVPVHEATGVMGPVIDATDDHHEAAPGRSAGYVALLSLGALGVVFGDIGTSPLYALREAFAGDLGQSVTASAFGVASLMFWAMVLVVTIKYIGFVMRADNQGEGGIMALTALVTRMSRPTGPSGRQKLVLVGLFGTALLYGDGIITPAISVLSAVEGLQVAAPSLSEFVVPISATIIVILFSIQRRGTGTIGAIFGPVMIIWFSVLAVLGVAQIVQSPEVIKALSPHYGIELLFSQPRAAFRSLGAIFLVVTGAEALYADMGHFGRRPIRFAWLGVVFPALTINYLGQAALLTREPTAIDNPFFRLSPQWMLIPLVLLATIATIIASQALISGAYSLTMQAVRLGYLPRVNIDHTSPREIGQIYIASVNWLLMAACVGVILTFQSSANLAAAYGIAVTATMIITTALMYALMQDRWGWNKWLVYTITAVFLTVDLAFLSANVFKIAAGGWFPLMVGAVVMTAMVTWHRGRSRLATLVAGSHLPIERFIESVVEHPQLRVPGTAVFMTREPGSTPPALLSNLRSNEVLHETVVTVSVQTSIEPSVPRARRASVHALGEGFYQVVLQYGFMENVDVPLALSEIVDPEFGFDLTDSTFFLGKELLVLPDRRRFWNWRERLYAVMHRNASSAAQLFNLPPDRVIEVGTAIQL